MDATKAIQIAVARADLIVCAVLRWLAVLVPLAVVFALALIVAWRFRPDPYAVNYDAQGVDVTSEGPDGDWTDAYYEWGDER